MSLTCEEFRQMKAFSVYLMAQEDFNQDIIPNSFTKVRNTIAMKFISCTEN
jgi:hypothetical protein